MKQYVMTMTEDTLRVIANACDALPPYKNRDRLIAYQVASTIKHELIPDSPVPVRWADEPLPEIRIADSIKRDPS